MKAMQAGKRLDYGLKNLFVRGVALVAAMTATATS